MSIEVIHIIDQLCREKGIDREVLIEAVQSAVEAAARKKLAQDAPLHCELNLETGEIEIYSEKIVVTTVHAPDFEISMKEAVTIDPQVQLGDTLAVRQQLENLGRIAAQLAKQVILQKVREAEIEIVYNEYKDKKGDLINGMVQRFEHGDIIVDLGKAEGILPRREQVFRETFNRGERIRAYILDVRKTSKNTLVILSRTHVGLIKRLFELEVPEISEGMVEIMGIVREPNGRTKIAVRTNDRDIDAVGACVGMRGMRVQSIVQELRGEKIDIVEYSEDPEFFIRNALSPAKISRILTNKEDRHMTIIVADDQMSLAIGKKGQNVRLAAKLVKWKIDIKGESEAHSLVDTTGLFMKRTPPREDFLEIIKTTKGFGENIVTIMFNNNVVSFDDVVRLGVDGLQKFQGIGPKKAEALFNFAEETIRNREAPAPETAMPDVADNLVYTSPSIEPAEIAPDATVTETSGDATEAEEAEGAAEPGESGEEMTATPETDAVTAEEGEEEEDEEDYGLEELTGFDPEIIQKLYDNEFQTVAELSVTPIEELMGIEGLDEETARAILDQARQLMDNLENA